MTAGPHGAHLRALAQLYAAPREHRGAQQPRVAQTREFAKLISIRATSTVVLVAINDAGVVRLIRAHRADHPELGVLSPTDRTAVDAAVLALAREGGPDADR